MTPPTCPLAQPHAPAARGVARCEAVTGKVAAIFGFVPVICNRIVGVATWTDTEGFEHSACGSHVRDMERRYPMGEPKWLHEEVDPDGIHETHSQDPSEGPSIHECPVCRSAFVDHPADATYLTEGRA